MRKAPSALEANLAAPQHAPLQRRSANLAGEDGEAIHADETLNLKTSTPASHTIPFKVWGLQVSHQLYASASPESFMCLSIPDENS